MTDTASQPNITYATYCGTSEAVTTEDGKYTVLNDGTMINCQAIDSEGFYVKSNRTPGEEVIGPCKIIDSKAFKHDILYMVKYNGNIFETLGSLSKAID
jgi:hypothetical protein